MKETVSFAVMPAARGFRETSKVLRDVLLQNRGVSGEDKDIFLNPDYDAHTHDPFLLKDMERAVARILEAVRKGERVVAYTDYDTDGIPAGVIFHDFFKKIGHGNFENYIPHRHDEGFGLNRGAIEELSRRGSSVVITADCGIADVGEVARAQELGIDVIVTDHHLPSHAEAEGEGGPHHAEAEGEGGPRQKLPPAYAIINPKQEGDAYPFKDLCGAGVAFKLVQALIKRGNEEGVFVTHEGWGKWLLDMAGIATLSDMVPLVGENRIFAYFGLVVLRRTRRVGLLELFRTTRLHSQALSEDDVGFVIGPRINVASRMDSPEKAFRLLATDNEAEALALVNELELLNNKRKGYVAAIVKEARLRIKLLQGEAPPAIVLGNTAWQPGLLGLAANMLMQEYERPVFLWGEGGDGTLKGSCRSDGSVHVVDLMQRAGDVLIEYGGHECSGGFSVERGKLHLLADALALASASAPRRVLAARQRTDANLLMDDVTAETYGAIEQLAPYGEGNPKPLFEFRNIEIKNVFSFGKQKNHLKLVFQNSIGKEIEAIKFFAEDMQGQFEAGQYINLLAHIERDTFNGRDKLRLRIVEILS